MFPLFKTFWQHFLCLCQAGKCHNLVITSHLYMCQGVCLYTVMTSFTTCFQMPLAISQFKSTLKEKKFITTENIQKNWLNGSHRSG